MSRRRSVRPAWEMVIYVYDAMDILDGWLYLYISLARDGMGCSIRGRFLSIYKSLICVTDAIFGGRGGKGATQTGYRWRLCRFLKNGRVESSCLMCASSMGAYGLVGHSLRKFVSLVFDEKIRLVSARPEGQVSLQNWLVIL